MKTNTDLTIENLGKSELIEGRARAYRLLSRAVDKDDKRSLRRIIEKIETAIVDRSALALA